MDDQKPWDKEIILGVEIDALTMSEALEFAERAIRQGSKVKIFTPNPEMLVRAERDKDFRVTLNNGDLRLPDGVGLQVGAEILHGQIPSLPILRELGLILLMLKSLLKVLFGEESSFAFIPERVAGVDFINNLLLLAQKTGYRVFLLGGAEGIAQKAADLLKKRLPGIKIVGWESGGRIGEDGVGENDRPTLEMINRARPDILIVSFGAPLQERWIESNFEAMNVGLVIGAGGTLDYFAQKQKRAPQILIERGLEWLWRLSRQPKRLSRIVQALVIFPLKIAASKYAMVKSGHEQDS